MPNPQQLHAGQPELSRARQFQKIVGVKPERIPRSNTAWHRLRKAGELGRMGCKGDVMSQGLPGCTGGFQQRARSGRCLQSSGLESASRARAGLPAAREVTGCLGRVVLPSARVRPAMLPLLRCVPRALGAAATGLRAAIPAPPLRHLLQAAPRPCLRPFGLLSVRAGSARRSGLLQPPVPCACGCGALHTEGKVRTPKTERRDPAWNRPS